MARCDRSVLGLRDLGSAKMCGIFHPEVRVHCVCMSDWKTAPFPGRHLAVRPASLLPVPGLTP